MGKRKVATKKDKETKASPALKRWYNFEGLKKIQEWAEKGLDLQQIADNMGITRQTLFNWREKYPEIQAAIDKGKIVPIMHVENALVNGATGYDYDEVTYETVYDEEGKATKRETKRVTKHVVGSATKQIFYLTNKAPNDYKDIRNIEIKENIDDKKAEIAKYMAEESEKWMSDNEKEKNT